MHSSWVACEDLQQPDGAIALVPSVGGTAAIEWFAKSHEVYGSVLGDKAGSDDAHYLNLTKAAGEGCCASYS